MARRCHRAALLSLPLWLCACVGAAWSTSDTRTELRDRVSASDGEQLPVQSLTRDTLRARLGEPLEIRRELQAEVWVYEDGLRWRGVILLLVVPVPLVVPWGGDELEVLFSEIDSQVTARSRELDWGYAWCGVTASMHGSGCDWD